MNSEQKKYQVPAGPILIFRWSLTLIVMLAALVFCFQSCSNSNAGGTTGGNPLQSSLPQQISADVQ